MDDLKLKLESLLFVSSKPLSADQLAKFTGAKKDDVVAAMTELVDLRKNTGVIIYEANQNYQLATHPQTSEIVTGFLNNDLREKLTDASLEVLAIIAYKQPIAKSEIEAIRGVNSQYSIRHLLMRGLIEKVANTKDARGANYQITTEVLEQLGLQSINDLPNFEGLKNQVVLPDTPTTATNV